jgi:hypothetical protein
MDNLHSFVVVLSVVAAIIVPQALALFYSAPRSSLSDDQEYDYYH